MTLDESQGGINWWNIWPHCTTHIFYQSKSFLFGLGLKCAIIWNLYCYWKVHTCWHRPGVASGFLQTVLVTREVRSCHKIYETNQPPTHSGLKPYKYISLLLNSYSATFFKHLYFYWWCRNCQCLRSKSYTLSGV